MYYIKLTFIPFHKPKTIDQNYINEISNVLWAYLGSLHRNGQVSEGSLIQKDGIFYSYFFMPELDSLNEKYCEESTIKHLADIKKDFQVKTEILGKNTVPEFQTCTCQESSWYVLYTARTEKFGPIICGDCLDTIPVYKFDHRFEARKDMKDIRTTLGWQKDYNLIDELWFNGYSDRFTYRQMSHPESRLSVDGMAICAAYEKALGKPFYYFMFHNWMSRKSNKMCPKCGGDWTLNEPIGDISKKCDPCRLVSF